MNSIPYIYKPYSPPNPNPCNKRHLTGSETVMIVALGVLAFFRAGAFDRTNPPFATLLRLTGCILTIFALFHRCFSGGRRRQFCPQDPPFPCNDQSMYTNTTPIVVLPSAPPPLYPNLPTNKYNFPSGPTFPPGPTFPSRNTSRSSMPVVHRTPAQPDSTPLNSASSNRTLEPKDLNDRPLYLTAKNR